MYQEDDDSVASSFEEDQMEAFIDRCSICFDSEHDLCVESCRDQFCLECFTKYINETVKSSWGLSVTIIKCPVCSDPISKNEWSQYVPMSVVELYDKYNMPYRSYARTCLYCNLELIPCTRTTITSNQHYNNSICTYLNTIISSGPKHITDKEYLTITEWIGLFKQGIHEVRLVNVYKLFIKDIIQFEMHHYNTNQHSYQLSLLFLKAAIHPDVWKQLQLIHISFFPNMNCSNCQSSICLHCGYDSHQSLTCEDNMKHLVMNTNLNTFVGVAGLLGLICSTTTTTTTTTNSNQPLTDYTNIQTEIGVPDMNNIQQRIRPTRQITPT
ncbi:hypothetical protein G6F57_001583 [Rhizopus arrhizus]|uniref:RING-type domain-containing protein n=1 Tax=Rhizopus oryzae TaxID=64495 RepID=A0A9P6X3W9_RHIOR|nr:hypothetical protein G6F24_006517 [Rhizopus arrhizus]KAG0909513.1 hypothetical protein G6F33_008716 [Rhizopus arrhizus]KAG0936501.1 hypothetical protein G6F30_008775 [Rhizopus arrhizus]KAG0957436.1 hypothetical protein G6F32_001170 [Rhizopus arrhizus]KAG0978844.1 hypothetical protein G6F29_009022 [Rhizopus arrhizus]